MAHTKAGGSTKLGRDSKAKRLGVKKQSGEKVNPGEIIIRQRGTKYLPGKNISRAGDDTLFSKKEGTIKFFSKTKTNFAGKKSKKTVVEVV